MLTSIRGLAAASLFAGAALIAAPALAETTDLPADAAPAAADNGAVAVADTAAPSAAPTASDVDLTDLALVRAAMPVEAATASHGEGEENGGFSVTGNGTIVSDYRFRGVSLSGGDPAIQGGFTVAHTSGVYVGTWGSSINDGGTGLYGDMEWDLFAGWSGAVAEGVSVDVGLLYYAYPTKAKGAVSNYWEPYFTLTGTIGPVTAKAGINYAWSQDLLANQDNIYLHTELSTGIPQTPITLSAHLGYVDGIQAPDYLLGLSTDKSAWDWSIGASATVLGHLNLGVTYVGVDAPATKRAGLDKGFTDGTVVVSVGASF